MKDDSTLWSEAYGIAMGDDEKAVIWYGVLKDEEMRKAYGRRTELYKGERRDNFLISIGVIAAIIGAAAVLFGICLVIIHINSRI